MRPRRLASGVGVEVEVEVEVLSEPWKSRLRPRPCAGRCRCRSAVPSYWLQQRLSDIWTLGLCSLQI